MFRLLKYFSCLIIILNVISCSNDAEIITSAKEKPQRKKTTKEIVSKLNYKDHYIIRNNRIDSAGHYQLQLDTNIGFFVDENIETINNRKETVLYTNDRSEIEYRTDNKTKPVSDRNSILKIVFDNDIFNNTDYYYTNGVNIEFISPIAKQSPLSSILAGNRKSEINLYGFSLMQNIYTPTNPDIPGIAVGDRPFSAFLTIGQFRESYNINRSLFIKSRISFGVLGPASLGGVVQSTIHNIEPVGWKNQISNNLVIDYSVNIEKGIFTTPHFEINITTGGNAGTIFNKIYGGMYFRVGNFIPVVRGLVANNRFGNENSTFQYWFFVNYKSNIVFYDATLQGGLFNTQNSYTLKANEINRLVHNISLGMAVYYKDIGLELENFYLSPEFQNALDFRWGRIKLVLKI